MSDKRKEKLNKLYEKRDALRAKDFDKVEAMDNAKVPKPMSMNQVYIDVALAVFFLATIIGAPIGLIFIFTAIFKYNVVKKTRARAEQAEQNAEEPEE